MPADLKAAHDRNDEVLEAIYIGRRFRNDTERLEKAVRTLHEDDLRQTYQDQQYQDEGISHEQREIRPVRLCDLCAEWQFHEAERAGYARYAGARIRKTR